MARGLAPAYLMNMIKRLFGFLHVTHLRVLRGRLPPVLSRLCCTATAHYRMSAKPNMNESERGGEIRAGNKAQIAPNSKPSLALKVMHTYFKHLLPRGGCDQRIN